MKNTNKKAFLLLKKLANQSYNAVQTNSQYMLARCYEKGYSIKKNYKQSAKWYRQAYISANNDIYKVFEDKIDDGFKYFCSGMILYDIAGLRQKNYTFKKYIKVFSDISDKVECPDQDLLNYIHWRDVKLVDNSKYGVFAKTAHLAGRTYSDLKENAAIIHYAGPNKPWTVNLTSYDIEKIWWEYAKITPFYYQLLEQVFYNHLDSSFTEDFIRKLNDENNELKNIIFKMNEVFSVC